MINYYLITKPGIIMGNLVTFAVGFLLAAKGDFNLFLFLITLLGLTFIMASACIFNNYIDRHLDKKMERTKNRPFVTRTISYDKAILLATVFFFTGIAILAYFTNMIAVSLAFLGFFVYVVLYSLWKSKTIYGTAIGSIAGATPPVIGYCAVSNQFDSAAAILFIMMVFWQMPHFFSIAIYHFNDYTAANIPVLPIKKGIFRTKIHMVIYILAFIFSSIMLTTFNYTGTLYSMAMIAIGLGWLTVCLLGFFNQKEQSWGYQMFVTSLLVIGTTCIIPFDLV